MNHSRGFSLIALMIFTVFLVGSGVFIASKVIKNNKAEKTVEEEKSTIPPTQTNSPTALITNTITKKATFTPTKSPTNTPTKGNTSTPSPAQSNSASTSTPTNLPTNTTAPTNSPTPTTPSSYQYVDGLMTVKIICGSPIVMQIIDGGISTTPNGVWTYAVNPQGEKVYLAYTSQYGLNAGATVNGSIYSIRGSTQLILESGKSYQAGIAPGAYSVSIPSLGTPISQVSFTINCN